MKKRLLFVINPISGDIDKSESEQLLRDFCTVNHFDFHLYQTTGQDDKHQLQRKIERLQPDAVIAVGGDGTVNLAGTALIGKEIALGIVPLGSGNGLSKDLKIPQDFEAALEVIAGFNIHPIDTLELNGHPSLHLSDVGFNALIVKRFSEGEKRGLASYAFHVVREYVNYQPKYYEVKTDREEFKGKAFMVTVANANMFGSNATINPTGKVDDGEFEVCILEEFPKTEGVAILYDLFTAGIHTSLRSRILHCRQASIFNTEEEVTQIDGEPIDLGKHIEAHIKPASLRVILPTEEHT
jgi:diacylglycerol kinase family enzyme